MKTDQAARMRRQIQNVARCIPNLVENAVARLKLLCFVYFIFYIYAREYTYSRAI